MIGKAKFGRRLGHRGEDGLQIELMFPMLPTREWAAGRAILDRQIIRIDDIQSEPGLNSTIRGGTAKSALLYPVGSRARSPTKSNTGCGSPGEADIAFRTSMVAAWYSIRSPYSMLRRASAASRSLSSCRSSTRTDHPSSRHPGDQLRASGPPVGRSVRSDHQRGRDRQYPGPRRGAAAGRGGTDRRCGACQSGGGLGRDLRSRRRQELVAMGAAGLNRDLPRDRRHACGIGGNRVHERRASRGLGGRSAMVSG